MKNILFLVFIFFLILGCDTKKDNLKDETQITENQVIKSEDNQNKLIIEGDDIWVRTEPSKGDVIMKLKNGTECIILEKGITKKINGSSDFWYKISCNGKEGWVFGSQTSIKQNNNDITIESQEITTFLNNFFEDLSNKKESVKKYFLNDSLYTLYNPGAIVYVSYQNYSVLFDIIGKYNMNKNKIVFGTEPIFDMDIYEWSPKGNFVIEQKNCTAVSNIAFFYNENIENNYYNIDKIKKIEKNISYKLIITEISQGIRFYFGKVNNQWKIIAIDYSTFDA